MKKFVAFTLATTASALAWAHPAAAQAGDAQGVTTPVNTPDATDEIAKKAPAGTATDRAADVAPPEATGGEAASAETPAGADIVVTGSRITRAGFSAPTPVTVLNTDTLTRKAPTSIADGLNQLPVFQNSTSAQTTAFTASNRVRTGNYLNLRSLGQARVLVLQDGVRLVPTGNAGGTDVNLIPQQLIERVDVVTGGAAAAYGSDAVSGVVNFVTNTRFTGLRAFAQKGISTRGDNGNYRIGAAAGVSLLEDRLHLIGSAERFKSDGIRSRADRPRADDYYLRAGAGTAASPYYYVTNARVTTATFGGSPVAGGTLATIGGVRQQFDSSGRLVPLVLGPAIPGVAGASIGGDGSFVPAECCFLVPGIKTTQLFANATYEVADNLSFFVRGSYNESQSDDRQIVSRNNNQSAIYADNAYLRLTPAQQALLAAGGGFFRLAKLFRDIPADATSERARGVTITAGLNGKFADDRFKWSLTYSRGRSRYYSTVNENESEKLFAATDAVDEGRFRTGVANGNIVCRVALTNPGLYPGCVPINLFGEGNVTAAADDYTRNESWFRDVNRLDLVAADLSGDIFETWAGPVSLAIGGEYRKQTLRQTSNSDPATPPAFTGIRGVPAGQLKFISTNVGQFYGSYTVKEAYAEVVVPLLKDSPLGRSLELNGAGRYTDYSTSGTVTTWKAGATYRPIQDIRLRATLSRDIRAPTLFELFSPATFQLQNQTDTTGRFVQLMQIGGGNTTLKPEIAKTFTGGIVLTPSFVRGLSFSADYFDIRIKDAIGTPFNVNQIFATCLINPSDPICAQIVRNANGDATAVFTRYINASRFQQRGIDFELAYRRPVLGGDLSLRVLATRLISIKRQVAANQPNVEFAGTNDFIFDMYNLPQPKWRPSFEQTFTSGGTTLSLQERLIGGYKRSTQFVYVDNSVPMVTYVDLNLTQDVKTAQGRNLQLFVTVNNLFNKFGPLWTNSQTVGLQIPVSRNTYDIIGRYVTAGMRVTLGRAR